MKNCKWHLAANVATVMSAPRISQKTNDFKNLVKGDIFPLTAEERTKTALGAVRSVLKRLRADGYCTDGVKLKLFYD